MDKLMIEEIESMVNATGLASQYNTLVLRQLLDTMREVERLRKMLDKCWTGEWFPGNEDFAEALYPNKDSDHA